MVSRSTKAVTVCAETLEANAVKRKTNVRSPVTNLVATVPPLGKWLVGDVDILTKIFDKVDLQDHQESNETIRGWLVGYGKSKQDALKVRVKPFQAPASMFYVKRLKASAFETRNLKPKTLPPLLSEPGETSILFFISKVI